MSKRPFSTGHFGAALNTTLLFASAICMMLVLSCLDLLYKAAAISNFQEAHAQIYRMGTKNQNVLKSCFAVSFWFKS